MEEKRRGTGLRKMKEKSKEKHDKKGTRNKWAEGKFRIIAHVNGIFGKKLVLAWELRKKQKKPKWEDVWKKNEEESEPSGYSCDII